MSPSPDDLTVIDVSEGGNVTIPQDLQRRLGVETPGQLLVYEDDGKVILEALPSIADLQGIHAGRYEQGEVRSHLEAMKASETEPRVDDS